MGHHYTLRLSTVFLLYIFFSSCGNKMSSEEMQTFNQNLKNQTASCENKKLEGIYKTYIEVANCQNHYVTSAYSFISYPYMDLIELYNSYRLVVAEKVDNSEITLSEANLIMSEVKQKIIEEESKRNYQEYQISRERAEVWRKAFEELGKTKIIIH